MSSLENLNYLPLQVHSFPALRARQQVYVDKTRQIFNLASQNGRFLFTRPRKFGKSLLISTFESLFKNGLEEFEGLAIEKLWREEQKYNVVRLDFLEIKAYGSIETFKENFERVLMDSFALLGFNYFESEGSVFDQLSDWMKTQSPTSLVLLIDNYDSPFVCYLCDEDFRKKLNKELSKFYALLQENDKTIRFLFVTGITNFCKHQLFFDSWYLSDISLDPNYGTLVGFTIEELTTNFSRFLDYACKDLSIADADLIRKLEFHYLGYCFEKTASQKVFSPWDILCFLTVPQRGFNPYWFGSGTDPLEFVRCFQRLIINDPVTFIGPKAIPKSKLSGSESLKELTDVGLLTQMGFLSIKEVEGENFHVNFSTVEVRTQLSQLYTKMLLGGKTVEEVLAKTIE